MTSQCDEEGKECRFRYVCFPLFKAKHAGGKDPCPEYRSAKEWNRGWT
jgi:hypothetical protein